jgi:octopine/nopaline transport system substrate-binding protein
MGITRRMLLVSVAVVMAGMGTAAAEGKRKVLLATDGTYAPFNYAEPSGKLIGFEPDVVADICPRMNVDCEWVIQNFDGMIPALNEGRFDAILASLSITDERAKAVDFSIPYYAGPTRLIASADSPLGQFKPGEGTTILLGSQTDADKAVLGELTKAFANATVGVERASTHAQFFEDTFPGVKVKIYDKGENMLLDLVAGRIDAAVDGAGSTLNFISEQEKEGKKFVAFGPALKGGTLGKGVALAFRKGQDADLREQFNKAIMDATADGTISRLSVKWIGVDGSISDYVKK